MERDLVSRARTPRTIASVTPEDDWLVTVCAVCLRASCWHGDHPCWASRIAATVERRASDLRALDREHPDHFGRETLMRVCGSVREVTP